MTHQTTRRWLRRAVVAALIVALAVGGVVVGVIVTLAIPWTAASERTREEGVEVGIYARRVGVAARRLRFRQVDKQGPPIYLRGNRLFRVSRARG